MANKYTEKKKTNAEQNAQPSNRPANTLVFLESERQQLKTDLMQGIREVFAVSLEHHAGDTVLAFRHLFLATIKRLGNDATFLSKLTIGIIAEAIYDGLTDEQKEDLRKDTDL